MEDTYILPPNLIELDVGDLVDVACLLPLPHLKVRTGRKVQTFTLVCL